MTRQVMKIAINGTKLICIYDFNENIFKLYRETYNSGDGWHRKLVSKDAEFGFIMKCAMSYMGYSI